MDEYSIEREGINKYETARLLSLSSAYDHSAIALSNATIVVSLCGAELDVSIRAFLFSILYGPSDHLLLASVP